MICKTLKEAAAFAGNNDKVLLATIFIVMTIAGYIGNIILAGLFVGFFSALAIALESIEYPVVWSMIFIIFGLMFQKIGLKGEYLLYGTAFMFLFWGLFKIVLTRCDCSKDKNNGIIE